MEKVNYVIALWSGPRRAGNDLFGVDPSCYLRDHLSSLKKLEHDLAQITLVVPENSNEPVTFRQALESVPKKIRSAEVVILERPNYGQSYGSWSFAFEKYRTQFDYYIFMEDDYIFVQDHFDKIMVEMLLGKPCEGYLCSYAAGHAAISNGISRASTLEKIWSRFNCLPHFHDVEHSYSIGPQMSFSLGFTASGFPIYDYLDKYRSQFNDGGIYPLYGEACKPDLIVPIQPHRELFKHLLEC